MKNFLPFEEAHKIVLIEAKKLGINSERKWQYQKRYGYVRHSKIPYSPQITYKNQGWVSYSHWLGTNNIRGTSRKYAVNDSFFKKWSHDMAYVLGFWWADGYIRKRKGKNGYGYSYGFGVCQNDRDQYILKNILDCMKASNPVWHPKSRLNMCHFEISSKNIFDDIIRLGGSPRKSLTSELPYVPKKYLLDFLRGYFDGDGCISLNPKTYSVSCYFCSGSEKFIKALKDKLYNTWGIAGKIRYSSCFRLCFGMRDTVKLGNMMYLSHKSSLLMLKRKYDKFNGLIRYRRQKYGV